MYGNGCDNARTIGRKKLEARVLAGLKDRMMTPQMATEAMRANAEETRLNCERRQSAEATRRELAETDKAIKEIVGIIEKGGWYRALTDRLGEIEKRQDQLTARLADVPADIHPGICETYRSRVERLTEALNHSDDALKAADAISRVIDRVVITPGETRKDLKITLHGDLETILKWVGRTGNRRQTTTVDTICSDLSASVKRRAGLNRERHLLAVEI